mgnify:CR=1 FL=1
MKLIKWSPYTDLVGWDEGIDRWFESCYTDGNRVRELLMPPLDIEENEHEYLVRTELPGVPREGVEVTVENGVLTIKGEKQTGDGEEKDGVKRHRGERLYGSYQRTLMLPDSVDTTGITGVLKDGVLTLTLRKMEVKKPEPVKVTIG